MIERITTDLLANQNPDGGWGSLQGKQSNTEATSFAIAGLRSFQSAAGPNAAKRGDQWLARRQSEDGSWPLNEVTKEGSWSTALAMATLSDLPENRERVLRAAHWLLQQEGSKPGILAQLIRWATSKTKVNELNDDLIGWPWVPFSFSWVEPTSYALIALKKIRTVLTGTNVDERIRQADAMIYDRMCKGGGWNYGNSKVLDYALWPYPDTTAVALIALQDHARETANQQSVQTLRQIARETDSGLALSWASVCLDIYGQETAEFKKQIERRFDDTAFFGETKTLALALMALSGQSTPFKFTTK